MLAQRGGRRDALPSTSAYITCSGCRHSWSYLVSVIVVDCCSLSVIPVASLVPKAVALSVACSLTNLPSLRAGTSVPFPTYSPSPVVGSPTGQSWLKVPPYRSMTWSSPAPPLKVPPRCSLTRSLPAPLRKTSPTPSLSTTSLPRKPQTTSGPSVVRPVKSSSPAVPAMKLVLPGLRSGLVRPTRLASWMQRARGVVLAGARATPTPRARGPGPVRRIPR